MGNLQLSRQLKNPASWNEPQDHEQLGERAATINQLVDGQKISHFDKRSFSSQLRNTKRLMVLGLTLGVHCIFLG